MNTLVVIAIWLLTLFCLAAQANLLHVPGVTKTGDTDSTVKGGAATPPPRNPSEDLYKVCSVAEDDEEEHVLEHLEEGADVNWVSPQEGITCLFSAVMRGKLQVVETVLDNGADISIPRKQDGLTPLHAAAFYGRVLILKAFQKRGLLPAPLDDDNNQGVPLLHRACEGFTIHHNNVISFLVSQGANINQPETTTAGRTCLDKAVHSNVAVFIEKLGGRRSSELQQAQQSDNNHVEL